MIDYEKELNPEQLQVVLEEKGPLLVIAGAGSGKTRTLTYRVSIDRAALFVKVASRIRSGGTPLSTRRATR